MTFGKSISSCYRNYFNIKGKASRSEYWWFQLYGFILGLIIAAIYLPFMLSALKNQDQELVIVPQIVLTLLSFLLYSIPNFTCMIRRLADAGISRWASLILFVPAVVYFIGFPFIIYKQLYSALMWLSIVNFFLVLGIIILFLIWLIQSSCDVDPRRISKKCKVDR